MGIGIEAINFYGGPAVIDVRTLFKSRGLDLERFDNLMMKNKSVGLPCEDSVTNAVNAAKPIVDRLTDRQKDRIEMVITCSESGLDYGKSLSTYVHDYLGLNRNCRLFEVKQACYAGTAGVHMANCFVLSQVSPGAKALVIATDMARAGVKHSYAEPSQGTGAIAMLVSDIPAVLEIDLGAVGCYSYEVMDTCRPLPDLETGDADLSLLSFLDCVENSFKIYQEKVAEVDYVNTFDYLVFHTPFAGMVKGAHRRMMRQFTPYQPDQIEMDFQRRVSPSLKHCVQVGNVYSGSLYLALCSLIDHVELDGEKRVGLFSYGSGCSSEFYSGLISCQSKSALAEMDIRAKLANRYELTMAEYERLLDLNTEWFFGIKDKEVDISGFSHIYEHYFEGKKLLRLKRVKEYHREYVWS